jgi:uracil-DNA glycosylase family 4
MSSNKKEQLDKLNSFMAECSKCALRAGCNRVVPGEGAADAEIMFIGEHLEKKEDELYHHLSSRRKILDEMLAIIN